MQNPRFRNPKLRHSIGIPDFKTPDTVIYDSEIHTDVQARSNNRKIESMILVVSRGPPVARVLSGRRGLRL